ncbi:MAG TPA: zinc-binding dehydrogenase [Stellaceae bacterium]|jgi:NADPH:quinone reductase-like Zn-dependent oxidoreductase|nr:zinc-binding dehydrogenase [Stellaceae bacterium]
MLAVVNTPSGPEPVAIRDVPEPAPKANEALVAVHAFSLNRGELRLFQARPEGWRPGQDIAGVVLKQAADGGGPPAGSRVVGLCDWEGWAERAAVPNHRIAAIGDTVSFGAAAALPVAGLTALRTLRHGAPLLGKRVLVSGAAGGVGNLAVQLAVRSGARVTAVVGSAARARVLDGLGAVEIVTKIEDAQGRFALILESAGGASLTAGIERIEAKGTIVVYGNSSQEPTEIDFRQFGEHQNARIQAFHYFTCEPEERFAPDLALLASLVADGSLKPRIVEHDWCELARIGPLLRERRIAGKAVFTIPQT